MSERRPGPDDLSAALRDRLAALIAGLERDRATVAADPAGVAAYDRLIDAARRALNNLGPHPGGDARVG